jgi:uncharacterized protein YbjQ (UPF0145 family)
MTIRKFAKVSAALFVVSLAVLAEAREDVQDFSIQDVLSQEAAKEKLSSNVKFFFGKESYPKPEQSLGTYRTNKKTNAFEKSEAEACNSAFLSAMVALEERALQEGGNAVVDIISNYDNNRTESTTTFKCGASKTMAGVALQGRVVKLPD